MNKVNKPILIAGLGSIGSRHLENLRSLGHDNIILYRSGKGARKYIKDAGTHQVESLEEGLALQPAGVIVSNPTSLHMPAASAAAKAGSHVLLEKPVAHTLDEVGPFKRIVCQNRISVLVGFQFRYHPGLIKIKECLENRRVGKPLSVQVHWGEYLPSWHSQEDYRKSYSARSDLGGGVVLTLSHPFDYLRWLIAEVDSVRATCAKLSDLDIDVEDTASITLRFANGVIGNVYLDYIERPGSHWINIVCSNGVIRWDNSSGVTRVYSAEDQQWHEFSLPAGFERNTMFIDEMKNFLNCLSGKEIPRVNLEDGVRALEVALAVKRSSDEAREIHIQRAVLDYV